MFYKEPLQPWERYPFGTLSSQLVEYSGDVRHRLNESIRKDLHTSQVGSVADDEVYQCLVGIMTWPISEMNAEPGCRFGIYIQVLDDFNLSGRIIEAQLLHKFAKFGTSTEAGEKSYGYQDWRGGKEARIK